MRHIFFKHILLCLCFLVGLNAFAYEFEVDGVYYSVMDDAAMSVCVTSGTTKYVGDVVIPKNVTFDGISRRYYEAKLDKGQL